jgi:transcriptional regulator with XRE-family HTH domain
MHRKCYTYTTETFYAHNVDILKRDSDFTTVGGRIRYHRLKQGLTMDKLAKMAGLSKSLLIRYENNRVPQTLGACNAIATMLQTEPNLIYDDYLRFIASDYSEIIRQARVKEGLSQLALGCILSITKKTVGRWERGCLTPNRSSYLKLSSYLHL